MLKSEIGEYLDDQVIYEKEEEDLVVNDDYFYEVVNT